MKKYVSYLLAIILAGFGLLTLFLSLFGVRAREGNYVLFVVWSNFISSILYLVAAYGFIKNQKWTVTLLAISTIILLGAYIGLHIHANSGGIYEIKTMGAMVFRTLLTLAFALLAYFSINRQSQIRKT